MNHIITDEQMDVVDKLATETVEYMTPAEGLMLAIGWIGAKHEPENDTGGHIMNMTHPDILEAERIGVPEPPPIEDEWSLQEMLNEDQKEED